MLINIKNQMNSWAMLLARFLYGGLASFAILTSTAHAYTQWEWQSVGIADSSGNIYKSGPGAQTTFTTKEQALSATRALSTHPSVQVLTQYTGSRRVSSGQLEYHYAAPPADPIYGAWRYRVQGDAYCGTRSTEAALLSCLESYYENQTNCDTVTIQPVTTWTPHVTDPSQNEHGDAQVGGTPAATCALDGTTISVDRIRTNTCPAGYFYNWPGYATATGTCSNSDLAVIRGRPLECPIGSPSGTTGNPCNAATGDKSQSETDYVAPGLTFTRAYHSAAPGNTGALGAGWSHSYAKKLHFQSGDASIPRLLSRGSGEHEILEGFTNSGRSLSGSGTQINKVGSEWVARLSDGGSEIYNTNGELIRIVGRTGLVTNLYYVTAPASNARLLSSVVGPYGHRIDLSYNGVLITSMANSDGELTQYGYDAAGNLNTVTFPDSTTREYLYEDAQFPNALTGIMDESGNRLSTYAYDSTGRVISSERAGGVGRIDLTYGATSTTVSDVMGLQTVYTFSATASTPRRITSISGGGLTEQFQLETDLQRRVERITDARGYVKDFTYNTDHLLSVTEAFGTSKARTTSYTYLSATDDLVTLERLATSAGVQREISTSYNAERLPATRTVSGPSGTGTVSRTVTMVYTTQGQVQSVDGPRTDLNDVTTYTYHNCTTGYECGQVATITGALGGHVTTYNAYDAHGRPLTMTSNGIETTFMYDLRGRLRSRTVGGEHSTLEYWPTGLLKKATLPDGSYLEYTYDAAHRLTGINDAEGNRVGYTLDAMGNRTAERRYDPSNALTESRTRVFDTLSRLSQEIGAADTAQVTTTFGYDNNGNQTSVNSPLGRNTAQDYDELNRLTSVTDPASGVTSYGYNALDQLISVMDPGNLTTTYTYDALGNLRQQSSPDTGLTTFTHDAAGNVITRTDARGASVGQGTYSYDALNRVTQIQYPDHTVSYTYDTCVNGIGRLCTMTDASGSTAYEYDAQGRVTRKSQTVPLGESGSSTRTVQYQYTDGRMSAVVAPGGHRINYTHDSAGRVSGMSVTWIDGSTWPLLSDVLYDPSGRVRGWTWANGTLEIRDYDQDGRVTAIESAGGSEYTYDDAGRITDIDSLAGNPAPSWDYGYDLLDRLTSAARAGQSQSFTYDANGNRISQDGTQASTYAYSNPLMSNRLQSISGATNRSYLYDAMGNVTSDGVRSFGYDGAGRMASAGGVVFRFNGLGQRMEKRPWPGLQIAYIYDEAGRVLEKCDLSLSGQCNQYYSQQYIWLEDIPVAALLPHIQYNWEGYVEMVYTGLYNVHTDHLNTPRRLTAATTAPVPAPNWRWDSDPFGTTVADGNLEDNPLLEDYDFDLRFPGQIFDEETGLHYNYYRDYDPVTGRYVQSDPIGLEGGLNTYAYVANSPILYADPTGTDLVCLGCHRSLPPPPSWTRPSPPESPLLNESNEPGIKEFPGLKDRPAANDDGRNCSDDQCDERLAELRAKAAAIKLQIDLHSSIASYSLLLAQLKREIELFNDLCPQRRWQSTLIWMSVSQYR